MSRYVEVEFPVTVHLKLTLNVSKLEMTIQKSEGFLSGLKFSLTKTLLSFTGWAITEFRHAFFIKSKPFCLAFFNSNVRLNILGTNKILRPAQAEKSRSCPPSQHKDAESIGVHSEITPPIRQLTLQGMRVD